MSFPICFIQTALERDYNALMASNRSKSTLPQIRLSESDAKIQEKIKTVKDMNEYVRKIREERKNKEKEIQRIASDAEAKASADKLPAISTPKNAPTPRVTNSASTPFPTINSNSDSTNVLPNNQGVKPSNIGGGLLRPMSQDASPLTLQKLKDDSNSESPRSSLLKRSHSHPNIAQVCI